MKNQKYLSYDDSKFEWVGKTPKGWITRRLKYNCIVNPIGKKSLSDPDSKVNFLPMEKVSEDGNYDLKSKTDYKSVSSGYTYFENNDVILAKITPCFENGKGALVENLKHGFGFGSTEFHVLRSNVDMLPEYLYFLTKSHLFRVVGEAFMEGTAGQKRIPNEYVKNFTIPIPPLNEQKNLIHCLNKKITEINRIIEKYNHIVNILREKKVSLITYAATSGLDNDFTTKDSGIEGIEGIPEHWKVKKIKYVAKVLTGKTPPTDVLKYYDEEELNWFTPGDLGENFVIKTSSKKISNVAVTDKKAILYKPFSVLIVGIGATLGKVGISNTKSCSNQQINAIEFNSDKIIPKYGLYYLHGIKDIIVSSANFTTIPIFNQTQTENFFILNPPIEEQEKIIKYIDNEVSKIDKLIRKIEKQICLLNEHKISLLNQVITGEINFKGIE